MEKSQSSADFDTLRAEFPAFGFAVYAYDPGGPVIAEAVAVIAGGDAEIMSAHGATLAEACAKLSAMLRPGFLESVAWAEVPDEPASVSGAAPEPPDIFG